MSHLVKAITAGIASADGGGFTAIASTATVDRDGEVIAVNAFYPLPASVPVHLDHSFSAASVVGRAVPRYVGEQLHITATLATTDDAQLVRRKLHEGVLDAISIVFRGIDWAQVAGVRTLVRGELLAADIVSIPSQSEARILSVRGGLPNDGAALLARARRLTDAARWTMMRADLEEAERLLKSLDPPTAHGPARRQVETFLRGLR